jgi:hypothetical protein
MLAKRDRVIAQMRREGRGQEAIGAELDVPLSTVDDVIARISGKRQLSKTGNNRPPPKVEPREEPVEDVECDDDPLPPAPLHGDLSVYLPLLAAFEPGRTAELLPTCRSICQTASTPRRSRPTIESGYRHRCFTPASISFWLWRTWPWANCSNGQRTRSLGGNSPKAFR